MVIYVFSCSNANWHLHVDFLIWFWLGLVVSRRTISSPETVLGYLTIDDRLHDRRIARLCKNVLWHIWNAIHFWHWNIWNIISGETKVIWDVFTKSVICRYRRFKWKHSSIWLTRTGLCLALTVVVPGGHQAGLGDEIPWRKWAGQLGRIIQCSFTVLL